MSSYAGSIFDQINHYGVVVKLSVDGDLLWALQLANITSINSIAPGSNGSMFIIGSGSSIDGLPPLYDKVIVLNENGDLLAAKSINAENSIDTINIASVIGFDNDMVIISGEYSYLDIDGFIMQFSMLDNKAGCDGINLLNLSRFQIENITSNFIQKKASLFVQKKEKISFYPLTVFDQDIDNPAKCPPLAGAWYSVLTYSLIGSIIIGSICACVQVNRCKKRRKIEIYGTNPNVNALLTAAANSRTLRSISSHHESLLSQQRSLHSAVLSGDVDTVARLLDQHANINEPDQKMHTGLFISAWKGHKSIVSFLLVQKADPSICDKNQWTPLHIAAKMGHHQIVSLLLSHKASLEVVTKKGCTPLHLAVSNEEEKSIKALIQCKADPFIEGPGGATAYDVVLQKNNKKLIDLLAMPALLRVWNGKKSFSGNLAAYEPIAPKTEGCAPGFIGKGPTGNQFMVKLGWPDETTDVSDTLTTTRRKDHSRSEVGAVKEKVGADMYAVLGHGRFYTAKHRLAILEANNKYSMQHPDIELLVARFNKGRKIGDRSRIRCVHVVSRWVEGYQNLNALAHCLMQRNDEESFSLMELLEKGMVPSYVRLDQKVVKIDGLMELLAVSRLLADTDVLGGRGDNVGFVLEKDANEEPVAVRVVKIDAGEAFGFSDPKNQLIQSFYPSTNETVLEDKRDLQWARNMPKQIKWSLLQPEQKERFLAMLRKGLCMLRKPGFLSLLIKRRGLFDKARGWGKVLVTDKMINELKDTLLRYLSLQEKPDVYGKLIPTAAKTLNPDPFFNPKIFGVANYTQKELDKLLENEQTETLNDLGGGGKDIA